jgi:dTMP kinase
MAQRGARGALVVLEGCDRAGKSTQCKKLLEYLIDRHVDVKEYRFPDRSTTIGKMISEYLECKQEIEDHVVHLLFSANRWEALPKMKKELESGTTLIVDRYAYSGVAFTASKPGFTLEWCQQPDVGLIKPDVVCFLDITSEEMEKRGQFGEERYERKDFQAKVRDTYMQLKDKDWEMVDAMNTVDAVHRQLAEIVMETISSSKSKPLSKLWTNENDIK